MSESGGFKVSDRRTSKEDDDQDLLTPEPAQKSRSDEPVFPGEHSLQAERPSSGDAFPEQELGFDADLPLMALPTVELAGFFISTLYQKTFIAMGMAVGEDGRQLAPDFSEARASIDLAECLLNHMTGKWGDPGLERELESQLAGLKLAYARMAPATAG